MRAITVATTINAIMISKAISRSRLASLCWLGHRCEMAPKKRIAIEGVEQQPVLKKPSCNAIAKAAPQAASGKDGELPLDSLINDIKISSSEVKTLQSKWKSLSLENKMLEFRKIMLRQAGVSTSESVDLRQFFTNDE
eukprot:7586348-Alexandrium_andersonii.AAC.1